MQGDRYDYRAEADRDNPERTIAQQNGEIGPYVGVPMEVSLYANAAADTAQSAAEAAQASADAAAALASASVLPVRMYDFGQGSDQGWQRINYSVADHEFSTCRRFTGTGANPAIYLTGLSLSPLDAHIVAIRLRLVSGTWRGDLYWGNAGHDVTEPYKYQISQPPPTNVWVVAVFDLRKSAQAADLMGAQVTKFQFQLTSDAGQVDVDWIALARYGTVSADLGNVQPGSVTGPLIAPGAIDTSKLVDLAVTGAKLAGAAVDVTKLADGSVNAAKVVAGAIGSTQLAAGAVLTDKIASGAVTTAALASGAVDASKILDGAVGSSQLAAGSVIGDKLATGAVSTAKLAAGSVDASKIVAGAVGATQLANAAVSVAKLGVVLGGGNLFRNAAFITDSTADGIADGWGIYNNSPGTEPTTNSLVAGGLYSTKIQRIVWSVNNTTTKGITTSGSFAIGNKWGGVVGEFQWNRWYVISWWARATAGSVIGTTLSLRYNNWPDTVTFDANPALAVTWQRYIVRIFWATPSAWQPSTVYATGARCANDGHYYYATTGGTSAGSGGPTGTGSSIPDGTVVWRHLTGDVPRNETSISIPNGTAVQGTLEFCAPQIEEGEAPTAWAPLTDEILPLTVTSTELAASSVIAGKIAAGTIVAADISSGAITTAKLAAGAVTANEIAAGAVSTAKLAAGAVTANEIAAGAVTATAIAANAVVAGKIAAEAVTASTIAAGAVTSTAIAANAIVAGKIAAGTIGATELGANSVVAGKIAASAISANEIASGAITVGKLKVVNTAQCLNTDPYIDDTSIWGFEQTAGTFETISDAKVGSVVIRSAVAAASSYAHEKVYHPIDTTKYYRVRFWVRPSSTANGTLDCCLRQWQDKGVTPCATNSGRSPFKPNAQAVGGSMPANTWTEISVQWGPGDWQAGVKFVQLDWRLNQGSTLGYMEICHIRFEEAVLGELIVDGVIQSKLTASDNVQTADFASTGSGASEVCTRGAKLRSTAQDSNTVPPVLVSPVGLKIGSVVVNEVVSSALTALARTGASFLSWYRGNIDTRALRKSGAPVVNDPAWARSTAYSVGDVIVGGNTSYYPQTSLRYGGAPNAYQTASYYYVCVTAGTSSASGNGPAGTGTGITDGSCVWDYWGAANLSRLRVRLSCISSGWTEANIAQIHQFHLRLKPWLNMDNLDSMRTLRVYVYDSGGAQRGGPFYYPLPDRLYQTSGTPSDATNEVDITFLCHIRYGTYMGNAGTPYLFNGYLRIAISNSYGWSTDVDCGTFPNTVDAEPTYYMEPGSGALAGGGSGGGGGGGGGCTDPDTLILVRGSDQRPRVCRIGDLKAGMYVWTQPEGGGPWGFHRVAWVRLTTNDRVGIRLTDGRALVCSVNHRMCVNGVWRRADGLRPGECVSGQIPGIVREVVHLGEGPVVQTSVPTAKTYQSADGLWCHNTEKL